MKRSLRAVRGEVRLKFCDFLESDAKQMFERNVNFNMQILKSSENMEVSPPSALFSTKQELSI